MSLVPRKNNDNKVDDVSKRLEICASGWALDRQLQKLLEGKIQSPRTIYLTSPNIDSEQARWLAKFIAGNTVLKYLSIDPTPWAPVPSYSLKVFSTRLIKRGGNDHLEYLSFRKCEFDKITTANFDKHRAIKDVGQSSSYLQDILVACRNLKYLKLSGNRLKLKGATDLSKYLQWENSSLRELRVVCCDLGPEGCSKIFEALIQNTTLRCLEIQENMDDGEWIEDSSADEETHDEDEDEEATSVTSTVDDLLDGGGNDDNKSFGALEEHDALRKLSKALEQGGSKITKLSLDCSNISIIGASLEQNRSLKELCIFQLGDEDLVTLGKVLVTNKSIVQLTAQSKSLDGFDNDVVSKFFRFLPKMQSLQYLYGIMKTDVSDAVLDSLADGLQENFVLRYVDRAICKFKGRERFAELCMLLEMNRSGRRYWHESGTKPSLLPLILSKMTKSRNAADKSSCLYCFLKSKPEIWGQNRKANNTTGMHKTVESNTWSQSIALNDNRNGAGRKRKVYEGR